MPFGAALLGWLAHPARFYEGGTARFSFL